MTVNKYTNIHIHTCRYILVNAVHKLCQYAINKLCVCAYFWVAIFFVFSLIVMVKFKIGIRA